MNSVIGFKEWQAVCKALGAGRQTLILRKGGIHEGREGFSFAHSSFFLFPTRFHATENEIRVDSSPALPEWQVGEVVEIEYHAEILCTKTLTVWTEISSLAPFHIYSETTIRDRFEWQGKGMPTSSIHVALVRVCKLATPWVFTYEKSYGGCRSWIHLPMPPIHVLKQMQPVLNDVEFAEIKRRYL